MALYQNRICITIETIGMAISVLIKKMRINFPIPNGMSDSMMDTALLENIIICNADTTITKKAASTEMESVEMNVAGMAISARPRIMAGAISAALGTWHNFRIGINGIPSILKSGVYSTSRKVIEEMAMI